MPIQQLNKPLILAAFFTENGLGKTGLTVTVDAWRVEQASATQIVTAQPATAVGAGFYYYTIVPGTTPFSQVVFKFSTASTAVDARELVGSYLVGPDWVETAGTITPAAVWGYATRTLTNLIYTFYPIIHGTDITIFRGDDYFSADGRALEWTDASWPSLTSASVQFRVYRPGSTVFTKNATLIGQTVRVELTSAETTLLPTSSYDLQATLSNTHIVTLRDGKIYVRTDVR